MVRQKNNDVGRPQSFAEEVAAVLELSTDIFRRPSSYVEIAAWLGVDRRFIQREVDRGHLKAIKLNGYYFKVMPQDLFAWLDKAGKNVIRRKRMDAKKEDARRAKVNHQLEAVEA
jgi:excisionase family DNA binding protein